MSFFRWLGPRTGPDRFARQVLGRLRAAGVHGARYHREQFAIEYRAAGDGESTWMYLGNIYAECTRDPDNHIDRIERFVATFVDPPPMPRTWAEAAPLIRPVLRGASFGRGGPMVHRPVLRRPALPYLDELIVVDQPTSMGYVAEGLWEIPGESVFARAMANLSTLPPPDPIEGELTGRLVLSLYDSGDSYVVSRMLLDGWLAGMAGEVGGAPVAFIPDPTVMVVAPDNPLVLGALFDAALEEYTNAARPLSPMAYTVDSDGRVAPYTAEHDHPLAVSVARASRVLAATEYESQRSVMAGDASLGGCAVARCMLVRREDSGRGRGGAFTVADWSGHAPALLPAVDYVAIDVEDAGPDDPAMLVPMEALFDEGLLIEAVEYRPTRYRVDREIGEDVRQRLMSRAVRR